MSKHLTDTEPQAPAKTDAGLLRYGGHVYAKAATAESDYLRDWQVWARAEIERLHEALGRIEGWTRYPASRVDERVDEIANVVKRTLSQSTR